MNFRSALRAFKDGTARAEEISRSSERMRRWVFPFICLPILIGCGSDTTDDLSDFELTPAMVEEIMDQPAPVMPDSPINSVFEDMPDSLNVLYVGNSYLAYRPIVNGERAELSVREQISSLVSASGVSLEYSANSIGGGTLEEHWELGIGEDTARGRLESGTFDLLIIQGRFDIHRNDQNRNRFDVYSDRFASLANEHGVKTVFFGLWATDKQITPEVDTFGPVAHEIYSMAAERNSVTYAPSGMAYARMYNYLANSLSEAEIELMLTDDTIHPSVLAAYLAANTVYSALFGAMQPNEKIVLPDDLDPDLAAIARTIALQAVVEFGN